MLWLYLHFPHLALDSYHFDLGKEQQLALYNKQNIITQFSQTLRQYGIETGISATTAYALYPDVVLLPEQETDALEALANWAYDLCPQLVINPPDGLLLEVSGMRKLYPSLSAYCRELMTGLQEKGYTTQLATGQTPLAAKLLAKSAKGRCLSEPRALVQQLDRLLLEELDIPTSSAEALFSMGIRDYPSLQKLPAAELSKRFGPELTRYLLKLTGQLPDPQDFYTPEPCFRRKLHLTFDADAASALLFPLKRLLSELESHLRRLQMATQSLLLIMGHRAQTDSYLQIETAEPLYQKEELLPLFQLKLERVQVYDTITAITLQVDQLSPQIRADDDLFLGEEKQHADSQRLLRELQAKFGEDKVSGLVAREDHRPEFASIYHPPGMPGPLCPKAGRPLWLLPTPEPLNYRYFSLLAGPERLQAAWWTQQAVQRDYFVARHHSGGLCWLYKDKQGNWFLHGWFS